MAYVTDGLAENEEWGRRPHKTRMYFLRKKLGHSQTWVEEFLHINHMLYSMLENGRIDCPYPWMIRRLEDYYGMKIEKLLEPADKDSEGMHG